MDGLVSRTDLQKVDFFFSHEQIGQGRRGDELRGNQPGHANKVNLARI